MQVATKIPSRGLLRSIVLAGALSMLSGCASTGGNPRDPLEPMNRAVFTFNEKADTYVMRPVAVVYDLAPTPVKTGVSNFFGNLGDLWIGVNSLLQGKPV
ncbi:MAG: VacJ family lipoprotein, partial [Zoogloea sp.]|nr:VacJ family lipoprotein [Zoogloea sp.]